MMYNKVKLIALIDKKIADANKQEAIKKNNLEKRFLEWKKATPAKYKTWIESLTVENVGEKAFNGSFSCKSSYDYYDHHGYKVTFKRYIDALNASKEHLELIVGDEVEIGAKKNKDVIWFLN